MFFFWFRVVTSKRNTISSSVIEDDVAYSFAIIKLKIKLAAQTREGEPFTFFKSNALLISLQLSCHHYQQDLLSVETLHTCIRALTCIQKYKFSKFTVIYCGL